ncbi:MAG: hypothetical protein ACYC63_01300 [Armatimonadota bacterium]
MPNVERELPLWAQIAVALWSLGAVVLFVRQILVAYSAALGGG